MVSFYDAERWERAEKKRNADFARLLAVARAAKVAVCVDPISIKRGLDAHKALKEALAAVEDLL